VQLVENDMVVGLGTGSTAALAIEVLAQRHGQGLRFVDIPTSERTASQAAAAGIPLTSFEANDVREMFSLKSIQMVEGSVRIGLRASCRVCARPANWRA
jgi:hypothetical protein